MTDQLRQKFENLELNAGQGKVSAFLSMTLGLLGVFAALCFLFPNILTTPELRPFYSKYYNIFYYSLLSGIVISALFGTYSATIKQNRYGFYGLCFAILAAILGCGLIQAPTLPDLPFYAGFDYFVITLIILALVFIPLEGFFAKNPDQKILRLGWVTDIKYFMFSHVGIQLFSFLTVMPIQYWITHIPHNPIVPYVQSQPIWLQFIELLIVVDFTTYWLHRAMHEINFFMALSHYTSFNRTNGLACVFSFTYCRSCYDTPYSNTAYFYFGFSHFSSFYLFGIYLIPCNFHSFKCTIPFSILALDHCNTRISSLASFI